MPFDVCSEANSIEEVGCWQEDMALLLRAAGPPRSAGRQLRWHRDQFGELAEVLGACGEEELIFRSVRSPEAETIELQDALEVGEQHLDFLPLARRSRVGIGQ